MSGAVKSRPRVIAAVVAKELVELWRDRRTLAALLLLPLLFDPLVTWLTGRVAAAIERRSAPTVAVWGTLPGEAEAALRSVDAQVVERVAHPTQPVNARLARGDVAVVLSVTPSANAADGNTTIEAAYDATSFTSARTYARVRRALDAAQAEQLAARLSRHGLPPSFATPLVVVEREQAGAVRLAADRRGRLAGVLLLLLLVSIGAPPAMDALAGERERGTLTALLGAGASTRELVTGKALAIALVASTTAFTNACAVELAASLLSGFSVGRVGPLLLLLVPLALVLVAALFWATSGAATVRQASGWSEWVVAGVIAMAALAALPLLRLSLRTALLPIIGASLTIRALFTDGRLPPTTALTVTAHVAFAAALLAAAARRLGKKG